jgi:phosphoribosylanthranilate isomerase
VVVGDWPRVERCRGRAAACPPRQRRAGAGEARQPSWQAARAFTERKWRIVLSAGLTPENVCRAASTVRPYAVDVNSGVEAAPGRKDPDKVWRFVAEARRAG